MNMFGGSVSFLESQFQQRLVQVCLFAAVLFWLLGSYKLIDQVQRVLSKVGLRFGKDSTRVVHALIFAVLLYLLTRFIMDPVVRRLSNGSVVEGQANQMTYTCPVTNSVFKGAGAESNCIGACNQPCVSHSANCDIVNNLCEYNYTDANEIMQCRACGQGNVLDDTNSPVPDPDPDHPHRYLMGHCSGVGDVTEPLRDVTGYGGRIISCNPYRNVLRGGAAAAPAAPATPAAPVVPT